MGIHPGRQIHRIPGVNARLLGRHRIRRSQPGGIPAWPWFARWLRRIGRQPAQQSFHQFAAPLRVTLDFPQRPFQAAVGGQLPCQDLGIHQHHGGGVRELVHQIGAVAAEGSRGARISRIALLASLLGGGHLADFIIAWERKAIELVPQRPGLSCADDRIVTGRVHDPDSLSFGLQTYLSTARLLPKLLLRLHIDSFGDFQTTARPKLDRAVASVSE